MAQAKKYGAFAGVFTPSILTILGVIMYMRLPWIAGQAGLYMVIGIVLVAHIVSVCTGFSVSSIATDKRVEGGGSYYIISRSLGLSLGGTLGIALFFGLSFSVSLYIIGFSESLNSFFGLGDSINAVRTTGAIVLVLITILTFISTSLVMRCQFVILGIIALSLLSILFGHSAHVPSKLSLMPLETAPNMMVLFGIFFPAVTGFEAGVSMSGDLKDPKRSIPAGTIIAIAVGLVVYISLPVFLLSRVDARVLAGNPKILWEISLFPPMVIAGIWAATISSAIGSILGAPRILQATAIDTITPKFFAKGHGKENEPRNALLLTFVIALSGILIGELDIIARIVSTFFLTMYGFLNLSCAIESWASSDFRPDFKIPRWVSIIGFLTCFIIMIELDLLALIGGVLIMGGLLFYLKKRELTLASGDVWENVWLSVVRKGLFKLSLANRHRRNWKPNILLFSGDTEARPHLVQFGKWIASQSGIVSNFDLIETPDAKILFPKSKQTVSRTNDGIEGIFIRRQECRDVYEGIITISRTYGFSGIEPNTTLMGWGRKTKDPEGFLKLLGSLKELDFNLLLMHYNESRGFGRYKTIDIWWRGAGNNGNFTLALVKFIIAAIPWREADIRFLIITQESALTETIQKNMVRTLRDARVKADVKVINNAAEQRTFSEIIALESGTSDLTIMGLPDISNQNAHIAIERANGILSHLGTTLLVHASSFFNDVVTGIEIKTGGEKPRSTLDIFSGLDPSQAMELMPLDLPGDEVVTSHVLNFDKLIIKSIFEVVKTHFLTIHDRNRSLLDALDQLAMSGFDHIERQIEEDNQLKAKHTMAKIHGDLLCQFTRVISDYKESILTSQKDIFEETLIKLRQNIQDQIHGLPERLTISRGREDFEPDPKDRIGLKWLKWKRRAWLKIRRQPLFLSVNMQQLFQAAWDHLIWEKWYEQFHQLGSHHFFWTQELQTLLKTIKDHLAWAENQFNTGTLSWEKYREVRDGTSRAFASVQGFNDRMFAEFVHNILRDYRLMLNQAAGEASLVDASFYARKHKKEKQYGKKAILIMDAFPQVWSDNQNLLFEMIRIDLLLMTFQRRLFVILGRIEQEWTLTIETELNRKIDVLINDIRVIADSCDLPLKRDSKLQFEVKPELISEQVLEDVAVEIQPAIEQIPESARTITEASLQQFQKGGFSEMDGLSVDLRELTEHIVYTELLEPLRQYLSNLPGALEKIVEHIKDALRFLVFNLTTPEPSFESVSDKGCRQVIDQTIDRIEAQQQAGVLLKKELADIVSQVQKTTAEKINSYRVIQSSTELRRYFSYQESQKVLSVLEKKKQTLRAWMQQFLVKRTYRQLQGTSGNEESEIDGTEEIGINGMLDMLERISYAIDDHKELPLQYKQLFLSDQPPHKDFWVGRQAELDRAQTAFQRFQSGVSGALMITGERSSGKSALSHYIANRFFKASSIYQVFAPVSGDYTLETFHHAMEAVFHLKGNTEALFFQIPSQSVIVFHDLELWWERHPRGNVVLNHMEWMIRKFGHQCFFIININIHALNLIRSLWKMDDYFLDVISCTPMTVEQLKTIILLRHKATGMKLTLGNQPEASLSELQLARLFRRICDYSKGNIGVALQTWIGQVHRIEGNSIHILSPIPPDTSPLSRLPMDWMVVILQFILHKRLSPSRLMRVMGWDEGYLNRFIDVLNRAGILKGQWDTVWRLNPLLEPFLTEQLRARGML